MGDAAGTAHDWMALLLHSAADLRRVNVRRPSHILPYEMRPLLQTYPHHSHLLGLLPPPVAQWLTTSYYLNLCVVNVDPATALEPAQHPSRTMHLDYSPYVGPYWVPEPGVITRTEWTDNWAQQKPREIVERIYAALQRGSYLQIHLNELFLRGSAAWRHSHQRHQSLIFGYDNPSDCFLCAGYDEAGENNQLYLARRLLVPALLSRGGRERSRHFANNYIAELHPEPPVARPFPIRWLREQFIDFGASTDRYRTQPDAVYGRTALRYLRLHFKACAERNLPADRKVTRFLWEMAKGMEVRLKTLAREEYSLLEHFIATASELEKRTNRLRLKTHAIWLESEKTSVNWGFLAEYDEVLEEQERYYEELGGAFELLG